MFEEIKKNLKEAEVDTLRAYVEDIVYNLFQGTDFFVNDVDFNTENGKLTFNVSALGGYDEETGASEEYNREVELDLSGSLLTGVEEAINKWKTEHNSPDNFYESDKELKETEEPIDIENKIIEEVTDFLTDVEGVSALSSFTNLEYGRVCKFTYDGSTYVVRVEEID